MLKPLPLAVLVAALALVGPAQAQQIVGPIIDSVDQSGSGANSGNEGQDRILRRNVSENRALMGLIMSQRQRDACHLQTRFRSLNNGAPFEGTGGMFDCQTSDGRGNTASERNITLPQDYMAEGVRVCLNSAGDEVKGVALIGTRLDCINLSITDMQADPSCKVQVSFERENCVGNDSGAPDGDWEVVSSCPREHYAIGVRLSTRASDDGRRVIDGIGLKCARVEP